MHMGLHNGPEIDRIRVEVDPDLEDLVPTFLENRRTDIRTIRHALERGDYRSIHRVGHNIRGDSGALGFAGLTEVGQRLERAALEQDEAGINAETDRLANYLERVDIVPAGRQD
jgi:HPt (histidine-containing phosphotransfer) domain-containing protein